MKQTNTVFAGMLVTTLLCGVSSGGGAAKPKMDFAKAAVILPFESTLNKAAASGLPDATRSAVVAYLKEAALFSAVLTQEEAKDRDKATLVEVSAKLVDFAPGNMAARALVGMGSGRAHAGYDFTIKDSTGAVIWEQRIKGVASVWSNDAPSSAQRGELPERVAKAFVSTLKSGK
jgi:hypothetical protein